MSPFVLFAIAVLLFASGVNDANSAVVPLSALFGIAGLGLFLIRWIRVKTSEFAVTDRRVIIKGGTFQRHSLEILVQKVEGVGVEQGLLGKICDYREITVSGTGGTKERFKYIENPLEFRRQVLMAAHVVQPR